jgi:AraC-like DNA-binding protein
MAGGPHGLALLEARFAGHAYDRHRHETYAIGITLAGVQEFTDRGALHASTPGRVIVLAPDERHDGNAGSEAGFSYRMLYVEARCIAAWLDACAGPGASLPSGGAAVAEDRTLAAAIHNAFPRFPEIPNAFATDAIVQRIAEALVRRERGAWRPARRAVDLRAVERARALLEEEEPVSSAALEAATGLDRFALARQFRVRFGTSPYRYHQACRQRRVTALIQAGAPLADAADEAGFADQPHMTRQFKAALGIAPGRFRALLNASSSV